MRERGQMKGTQTHTHTHTNRRDSTKAYTLLSNFHFGSNDERRRECCTESLTVRRSAKRNLKCIVTLKPRKCDFM